MGILIPRKFKFKSSLDVTVRSYGLGDEAIAAKESQNTLKYEGMPEQIKPTRLKINLKILPNNMNKNLPELLLFIE